jgi:hypothetical protein|tara:strand:+ start:178 stop:729 length:552 start_codon:yes stop_codon:yes gene_type:complete
MKETKQVIYEMLTESTGEHFLDSGGYYGRHWETNQKKTIDDFDNEPDIIIEDVETDYPYRVMSLYHHLTDNLAYLEDETEYFNEWIKQEGRDNVLHDAEDYLEEFFGYDTQVINTYNDECDLTQTIQFVGGKIFEDNIIALSIHNGADVRGGYTDYRIFRIMDENFYFWHESSDEIKDRIGAV